METVNFIQGSAEWHEYRNDPAVVNASDLPAAAGCSPYVTRDQLLTRIKTGVVPPVSPQLQKVFDRGHELEEKARPLVEMMLGDELFPVVGYVEIDGIKISASFDGLNMMETIGFEHKQLNETLPPAIQDHDLPEHICLQLDQQLFVSGAEFIFFVCSDGTLNNFYSMKYFPDPERLKNVPLIWKQFLNDLETFVPEEKAPALVGEKLDGLPIIQYRMEGLTLHSNLDLYQNAALELVERSKQVIETDQDFADAAEMVKSFEAAEKYIKQVQNDVLAEVADIQAFTQKLAEICENIRQARLNTSKQIETRKTEIKQFWVNKAQNELNNFLAETNEKLPFDIRYSADWQTAIKGKRGVAGLKSGLNDELANSKMEIVAIRDRMEKNHSYFKDNATEYLVAFADLETSIRLDYESFVQYVESRIQDYKNDQAQKMAANDTPPQPPQSPAMDETPPPVQTDVKTPEQSQAIKQGYADDEITREQKLEEIHADLLKVVGKVNAAKVLAAIAENQIRHIHI